MLKTTETIKGVEFANLNIEGWQNEQIVEAEKYIKETTNKIKKSAKNRLKRNIRFGFLYESIKTKNVKKKTKDGQRITSFVGVDAKTKGTIKGKNIVPIKYAHLVENGFTHAPNGQRIEGKPFLRPSVNEHATPTQISQNLKPIIDKVARSHL